MNLTKHQKNRIKKVYKDIDLRESNRFSFNTYFNSVYKNTYKHFKHRLQCYLTYKTESDMLFSLLRSGKHYFMKLDNYSNNNDSFEPILFVPLIIDPFLTSFSCVSVIFIILIF